MTADEAAGGLKSFAVHDPTWVSGGMSIPAAEPKELGPDDTLFVECIFDNSVVNQRTVGGEREEPRDLKWAEDGAMCVGFVTAAQ